MIPPFTEAGLLPPGIYWATWEEIVEVYGWNSLRQDLLSGLRKALMSLQNAGCKTVYLDGSFITSKEEPGDFDGCWEPEGVALDLLETTLLDFTPGCYAQKKKFQGELLPILPSPAEDILKFFQSEKVTGVNKGILAIDLRTFE